MKNNNRIKLLIVFSLAFLIACEKDKKTDIKIDYRSKYTGKFEFTVDIFAFNYLDSIYFYDTIVYTGNINYGHSDSLILIEYLPPDSIGPIVSIEPIVKEEGTLIESDKFNEFEGKFESSDKISFRGYSGGLGGGMRHVVVGTRK